MRRPGTSSCPLTATMRQPLLILGTTATGKSSVAVQLARLLAQRGQPAEIVSVDSMKIYKHMDIGTNKPAPELRALAPWHLLDIIEPHQQFTAADFVRQADLAIRQIQARSALPILVGGTALYIQGLLYGFFDGPSIPHDHPIRIELNARLQAEGPEALHRELARVDPATAQRLHPADTRRVTRALEVFQLTQMPLSQLQTQWTAQNPRQPIHIVGLRRPIQDEHARSDARVRQMIQRGLIDEVRTLLDTAHHPEGMGRQAAAAVGYAETILYIRNQRTLEQTVSAIQQNTRRLGKHQRTWFRQLDRRNAIRQWLDLPPEAPPQATANALLHAIDPAVDPA